jgi:tetratricopeptide (TPR) repeat protein
MTPAEFPVPDLHEPVRFAVDEDANPAKQGQRSQAAARPHDPNAKPLSDSKADLIAWAYTEYHRLRQQGQPPAVHEWCANFPTCRTALRDLLEADGGLGSLIEHYSQGSTDESLAWPFEGDCREGFTIVRELARGAFARVYLAAEAATGGRLVVVKCSLHGDAEARTMGRLAHPHIVPILSARREERSGLTMVCMPYLGNATLEDVLDRAVPPCRATPPPKASFILDVIRCCAQPEEPPPPCPDPRLRHASYTDGVIHLAAQLAETLAFLHEHGVCHRDLKPSNVLLDPSGKPLLLDFNISDSKLEAAVPIGGTLRYMAPEQIRAYLAKSKDGLDERADFYGLAVIVYELLGGVHPGVALPAASFGPDLAKSMLVALNAGFRPFRSLCPQLERPVAAMLDRCLSLDAAQRPANAAELAAALKRQFTPARRLRRWFAARPRSVLATLCLLVAVVAALGYAWAVTPPYGEREYERGRIAYHAGNYDAAEQHFDRAWRAEPNNSRFRYARGCARLQQSKLLPKEKARFDLVIDDLASTQQGDADARTLAVNAYVQARKQHFAEAIRIYNDNDPALSEYRPVMLLNNRGYSYLIVGRLKEAQKDLDQAVLLDPHCQAARHNRAMLVWRMRMTGKLPAIGSQALEDVEQALRLGPTTSNLYRDAAVLYAQAACDDPQKTQFERALSFLRQAIIAGEPPANFNLSQSLREALKRPEFASLADAQPTQAAPQPELRLIDPVDLPE